MLPLIDEHARHWLLLQADLQQQCFFVYDSCPASQGRDKEERKLLIDLVVKFSLSSPTSSYAPFTDSLIWHVCFLFFGVPLLRLHYCSRTYTLMWWRWRKFMLTAQLKPSKFSKLLFHCFVEHFLIYITLRRRGRCVVHIFIIHLYTAVAFAHAVATIVGSLSWSSWTSFQSMEACFVSPKLTCGNCARNA